MTRILRTLLCSLLLLAPAAAAAPAGKYANFRTAIYVTVESTKALADPAVFARQYARVAGQLKFDKVYIEVYRNHVFATDAEIEAVKKEFEAKGVAIAGGVTLAAGGQDGQFGTFDYEDPADRAECEKAAVLAARHFNEFILDDFFFYNTKSDADIAAKGTRSWTQYRLDTMRKVARDLVLGPAKAANPDVKVIIKYPNWYEHFQGLGYDLDQEAKEFDGIYTGTETRDPYITDQLLQQYESYEIIRYFDNIRPGGNGGGWVDTYGTRYVDRYAEELWDTMFAKAPQIMLFNWQDLAVEEGVKPGDRPWSKQPTSFSWQAMEKAFHAAGNKGAPGWASVASESLRGVDRVVGELGKPIGIPSYKPYQSYGEDFLQNYLGNIGIPIEMTPEFPAGAGTVLLTQEAAHDPDIVAKIEQKLKAGGDVIITSGLLRALQHKGIKDVAEWEPTGNVLSVTDYYNAFGAGNGISLDDPKHRSPAILFPEIRFYTNDSWALIRGVAVDKGNPVLLMNRYSKGILYLLTIPENESDLYNLPQPVITRIKHFVLKDFPVRIDAPARVTEFAYDNDTVVVESYRDTPSRVNVIVPFAGAKLLDLATGKIVVAGAPPRPAVDDSGRHRPPHPVAPETVFPVSIEAHSWRAYRIEH